MKTLLSTLFLASLATTSIAFAQSGDDPKRMAAVKECVTQAQLQIPQTSTDPNDPNMNARFEVYASCMRTKGFTP